MNGEGRWRHLLALAGDRNNECGEQRSTGGRERERMGGFQALSVVSKAHNKVKMGGDLVAYFCVLKSFSAARGD